MPGWKNLKKLFQRSFGLPVEVDVEANRELLAAVKRRERKLDKVEDGLLRDLSADLIRQAREGASGDDLLIDAFALVREAARRTIGLRPFDVQVMAAIAMHQGNLAEMQTGEGKTLAAVFPAYLNALDGQGVHVLTFNDYLARRDAKWMGPIYNFLGLTVEHVQQGFKTRERQRKTIQQYRREVLLDKLRLNLLSKQAPLRYSELREKFGLEVLRRVEKQITLFHVDHCWTEHLAQVAEIREGIQWRSIGGSRAIDDFQWLSPGGTDPLIEFQTLTARVFQDLRQRIDNAVVEGFLSAEITENGIDVDKEGLRGPSSTWTYLISDNPFGDWIERVFKGLKKALTK